MRLWQLAKWMTGAIGLLMVLSCAGGLFELGVVVVVALYVCFGWIGFVGHILPHVTVNGEGVATAAGCLIAVAAGAQWFFDWLWTNTPRVESIDRPAWQPRWTAALIAGVLLMFASGLCVVGAAHQTAWLVTSKERLLEDSVREAARKRQLSSSLKDIGLSFQMHEGTTGALPAAATFGNSGRPLHSWQTRLLPFFELEPLYKRINQSLPWDHAENHWAFTQRPSPYLHPKILFEPDERGYARSGYAGNAYVLGGPGAWRTAEMVDGAAKTILCGEAITAARAWGDPVNWRYPARGIRQRADSFGGAFQGITQFVFADGHTAQISNNIESTVLRALCTPTGGEEILEDDHDY